MGVAAVAGCRLYPTRCHPLSFELTLPRHTHRVRGRGRGRGKCIKIFDYMLPYDWLYICSTSCRPLCSKWVRANDFDCYVHITRCSRIAGVVTRASAGAGAGAGVAALRSNRKQCCSSGDCCLALCLSQAFGAIGGVCVRALPYYSYAMLRSLWLLFKRHLANARACLIEFIGKTTVIRRLGMCV